MLRDREQFEKVITALKQADRLLCESLALNVGSAMWHAKHRMAFAHAQLAVNEMLNPVTDGVDLPHPWNLALYSFDFLHNVAWRKQNPRIVRRMCGNCTRENRHELNTCYMCGYQLPPAVMADKGPFAGSYDF